MISTDGFSDTKVSNVSDVSWATLSAPAVSAHMSTGAGAGGAAFFGSSGSLMKAMKSASYSRRRQSLDTLHLYGSLRCEIVVSLLDQCSTSRPPL